MKLSFPEQSVIVEKIDLANFDFVIIFKYFFSAKMIQIVLFQLTLMEGEIWQVIASVNV